MRRNRFGRPMDELRVPTTRFAYTTATVALITRTRDFSLGPHRVHTQVHAGRTAGGSTMHTRFASAIFCLPVFRSTNNTRCAALYARTIDPFGKRVQLSPQTNRVYGYLVDSDLVFVIYVQILKKIRVCR